MALTVCARSVQCLSVLCRFASTIWIAGIDSVRRLGIWRLLPSELPLHWQWLYWAYHRYTCGPATDRDLLRDIEPTAMVPLSAAIAAMVH